MLVCNGFREGQRVRITYGYDSGKIGVVTGLSMLKGAGKRFYSVRLPGASVDELFPEDEIVANMRRLGINVDFVNVENITNSRKDMEMRSSDRIVRNAMEYAEAKNAVPVDGSFTPMAYIKGLIKAVKAKPAEKDLEGGAWKVVREKANYKALASTPEYKELDKLMGINSEACNAITDNWFNVRFEKQNGHIDFKSFETVEQAKAFARQKPAYEIVHVAVGGGRGKQVEKKGRFTYENSTACNDEYVVRKAFTPGKWLLSRKTTSLGDMGDTKAFSSEQEARDFAKESGFKVINGVAANAEDDEERAGFILDDCVKKAAEVDKHISDNQARWAQYLLEGFRSPYAGAKRVLEDGKEVLGQPGVSAGLKAKIKTAVAKLEASVRRIEQIVEKAKTLRNSVAFVQNAFDANTPGAKKFIDAACKIAGGPSNLTRSQADEIKGRFGISDKDVDSALRFFQFDGMKDLK